MTVHVYIIRRALLAIPLLLGITLATFLITHLVPVDPVAAMLGDRAANDPGIVASYRARFGLDKSPPEQYITYVARLFQGDWGISLSTRKPVLGDLAARLPATIELAIASLVLSAGIGIPLGVLGALKHDRPADHAIRVVTLAGASIPVFWLGLIALYVFYAQLNILPGPGRIDAHIEPPLQITGLYTVDSLLTRNWQALQSSLAHLILPAVVLGSATMGLVARVTRSSMLEVMGESYIVTARSKGLPERIVIGRHALRNGLIPTVTVLGLTMGGLLAGAVLTETIFSWPGIGLYAVNASYALDFPGIMGVTLIISVIYIVVNLIVDVLYILLDPTVGLR